MDDELKLQTAFEPRTGLPVELAQGVSRIVAPNAGPMTFHGTNSYIVGQDTVLVIDPGPDDDSHLAALERAIAARPVEAILVTHTHVDHTGLVRRLAARTGAPVMAEGPHRTARALGTGEGNPLDAAGDWTLPIDRYLADGQSIDFGAGRLQAVATPGHAANHMAFALPERGILFSGDHVMAWATTLVAPPEGSMADYMASLEKLMARPETLYLPGHGGPLRQPQPFMRGLRAHRRMREKAIFERVLAGEGSVLAITGSIYRSTDQRLQGAAALNVLAHLEHLAERGLVTADGPPGGRRNWRVAG